MRQVTRRRLLDRIQQFPRLHYVFDVQQRPGCARKLPVFQEIIDGTTMTWSSRFRCSPPPTASLCERHQPLSFADVAGKLVAWITGIPTAATSLPQLTVPIFDGFTNDEAGWRWG